MRCPKPRRMLPIIIASALIAHACPAVADPPAPTSSKPESPAAPTPADAPKAITPRATLWPRFEKGQKAVLRQTTRKSKQGDLTIAAKVRVEVLDKTGDQIVIRWEVGDIEMPEEIPEKDRPALAARFAQMKSPPLDILIQEDVGVVGLRDWEKTRDEVITLTERLIKAERKEVDPEILAKSIGMLRQMMSTREGAEGFLLKQVRPYFDGAYHELAEGDTITEDVELPMPIGDLKTIPAKRVLTFQPIDPAKPHEQTITADVDIDREGAKAAIDSIVDQFRKSLRPDDPPFTVDDVQMSIAFRWTLDTNRGWPSYVRSATTNVMGKSRNSEEFTWTLIEGPTPQSAAPTPTPAP